MGELSITQEDISHQPNQLSEVEPASWKGKRRRERSYRIFHNNILLKHIHVALIITHFQWFEYPQSRAYRRLSLLARQEPSDERHKSLRACVASAELGMGGISI